MRYTPAPVPAGIPKSARAWLADELRKVASAVIEADAVNLAEQAIEPVKLADGIVAYANGVDWDPGLGEGVYARINATWESLGYGNLNSAADETILGDWIFSGSVDFDNTVDFTGATVVGLSSDDLSDVASIAMLDEDETVTGSWGFTGTSVSFTPATLSASPTGNFNINPTGVVQILSGNKPRFYDPDNNHYAELYCENISTSAGHRSVLHNATDLGAFSIQRAVINDDATATFDVGSSHSMVFVVTTYNRQAAAHLVVSGTQAPQDLGSGPLVNIAATNPDVDGDVNIWPNTSGQISIKNRLGSTRTFTVFAFGDTQ